ncbi:MAG TPA: LysM peptidoglycan-binding domain-containing protein [Planctomycetota bacterium]|nr:LysM peptidoglycan-binding domain-containing protein [Planctomycetota bacterium]
MGRGNVWMMTGKKRSNWGYFVFALVLFALLYIAHETFFRRSHTPPPVSIPTVGVAVERAYNTLDGGFRGKVSLAEFAGMFHLMAAPDLAGELPEVRQAGVTDSTGPEHPVARFRVDYPNSKVKAEYHFARIEGIWQLQSFTRIPSELETPPKGGGLTPPRRRPQAGKDASGQKTVEPDPPPAAEGGLPATPCDYIIQPGDTPSGLSERFYGTTRYWRRILEANPGLTERNLRIGRRIRIPSNPEPPAPRDEAEGAPRPPVAATP